MGIRSWLGLDDDDGDRSLIEISNDRGTHIVVDVPTDEVGKVNRALRKAGVGYETRKDRNRDPDKYRSRSTRVIDEQEDYEDSHDAEPERWWGGFW